MDEIYLYSQNTLSIDISDASNPAFDADDDPIVSIVDVLTGTVLYTGAANPLLPGNYNTIIPFNLTITERQLRVDWTYTVASNPIVQSQWINIVTPYASLQDLRTLSSLGKSDDDLKFLEQTVRTVINNYTAQSFGSSTKTITVNVEKGSNITLPERAWLINSVYSQYDPNQTNNLFTNGTWIQTDPWTLTSKSRFVLGEVFYEDWYVTGPMPAPIIASDTSFFSPHSYRLTINGNFGYQSIPTDIKWAAKRLANTYLCNDDTYRVKQVQTVGSNTWTVGFNSNLQNSTGDLDVDNVLSNYYIPRMGTI